MSKGCLNSATNQHQNYLIHRAWNQSDLQAMKMQMKNYGDNPEGFVEQMVYYINSNKANHDNSIAGQDMVEDKIISCMAGCCTSRKNEESI